MTMDKASPNGPDAPRRSVADPERSPTDFSLPRVQDAYTLAPVPLCQLDALGRIEELNLAAARLLGDTAERLRGRRFVRYVHPDSRDDWFRRHATRLRLCTGDGGQRPVLMERSLDEDGRSRLVLLDVSALPAWRAEPRPPGAGLSGLAARDSLTGLANRRQFLDTARQTLRIAQRHDLKWGLLRLDLDAFADLNRAIGRAAGDRVLRVLAARLREATRGSDSLGRLEGDEFCVLFSLGREGRPWSRAVNKISRAVSRPLRIGGHQLMLGASMGVSLYPCHGADAEVLLRRAGLAMRHHQQLRRAAYHLYGEEMEGAASPEPPRLRRLRAALLSPMLRFMPQVDIGSGDVPALDVCLKLPDRERPAPAADYVPLAEELGVSAAFGQALAREAVTALAGLREAGCPGVNLSLALPPASLAERGFIGWLRGLLQSRGLAMDELELAFSEQSLLQEALLSAGVLERLSEVGARIAVDDYGTDCGSLAGLRHTALQTVKLSPALVSGVIRTGSERRLLGALLAFVQRYGLQLVAKGVDGPEQAALLSLLGCRRLQGEWLSPALAAPAAVRLIRAGMPALPERLEGV
ncbi:EAL domain-containing protein [Alkalilimnicola sp. S0819]|uniref:EAL domain-containing protein n=1 Tax=Alkalilimnicola sp. S0819 TaxID=2613922 RepID=UPI001869F731|nr:EAL domain-containing protein [Alkalilimnicola sp. S0819]